MFYCDYHTHTKFSFDGDATSTPDSLCHKAVELGITDLAITDHCDVNSEVEEIFDKYDAECAYTEICQAREKYKNVLNLTYGIELGQATQYPEYAQSILSAHKYEFVIGSLHNLRGVPDFCMLNFSEIPYTLCGQLFSRTLDELTEIAGFPGIDTIGHLTYQNRYMSLCKINFDFSPYYDRIAAFYEKIIQKNIALEINTSTLWRGFGFSMPDVGPLKLYRDVGGHLITVGSDAHAPLNLGRCIKNGFDILNSVGLHHVTVIRNGEKIQVPIE